MLQYFIMQYLNGRIDARLRGIFPSSISLSGKGKQGTVHDLFLNPLHLECLLVVLHCLFYSLYSKLDFSRGPGMLSNVFESCFVLYSH